MNFDKRTQAVLPRNFFDLSYKYLSTGKIGKLYPVYREEVVPGDRIKLGMEAVVRFEPLLAPVMQNIDMNVEYFFVPFRIMDKGWTVFLDGGISGEESETVERDINNIYWTDFPSSPKKTLWDYFGLPVDSVNYPRSNDDVLDYHITGFYRTAYNMIYNRYYRDENVMSEVSLQNNEVLSRLWRKDYFTSALPFRQRGDEVSVPINTVSGISVSAKSNYTNKDYFFATNSYPMTFYTNSGNAYGEARTNFLGDLKSYVHYASTLNKTPFLNGAQRFALDPYSTNDVIAGGVPENMPTKNVYPYYDALNLSYVDVESESSGVTRQFLSSLIPGKIGPKNIANMLEVNNVGDNLGLSIVDLRLSNQLQLFKELSARSGARYEEFLLGMFGVSPRSDVLQEPYYIGGFRRPVIVSEVLQTSEGGDTPQGNLAGRALGAMSKRLRPFTVQEPGVIIGLFSLSVDKLYYNQGYGKELTRASRFDYYFPLFSHLSEQPILRQEIYASFVEGFDNKAVFGYQEIFDEYRHRRDIATAEMQGYYSFWNFGSKYDNYPSLNKDFLEIDASESPFASVDENSEQFVFHIYNYAKAIRPLPKFGVPGSVLKI